MSRDRVYDVLLFLCVMELNKKDGSPFFILGLGVCFVIALVVEAYMQSRKKSNN